MNVFCLPISESELQSLARHCARGDHHLADELAQHVRVQHFRGRFDPERGAFKPWAMTCMRRYHLSTLRSCLVPVGDGFADHAARPAPHNLDIDLTTPFGPADLADVRSWHPRPRFVLLGWAGLWEKLPDGDQHDTIRGARVGTPAAPAELRHLSHRDRTQELAAALGVRRNSIAQILCRDLDLVRGLRFVRELRGE